MQEILISKLYSGKFIGKNLGHEIINFFKSDNGRQYIFINAHGTVGQAHLKNPLNAILLVKGIDRETVEIIAKIYPKPLKKKRNDVFSLQ